MPNLVFERIEETHLLACGLSAAERASQWLSLCGAKFSKQRQASESSAMFVGEGNNLQF